MIKSQDFTTSLDDTGTSSFGDSESADSHFWDSEETVIISNGSDQDSNLVVFSSHVLGQAGNRKRWAVDFAHKETLEHNLVEFGVGSASQETVKLYKKTEIYVRTFWFRAVADLLMVLGSKVDSLQMDISNMT